MVSIPEIGKIKTWLGMFRVWAVLLIPVSKKWKWGLVGLGVLAVPPIPIK